MIHSLAGGNIGKEQYFNFAFVEILDGAYKGSKAWYISKVFGLKAEDIVLVSFNNIETKARVIRVDKNVSSFASPVPVKRAKTIIKKI